MATSSPGRRDWPYPQDVVASLERQGALYRYLSEWADHKDFTPLSVSIRTPTAKQASAQFDAVQAWVCAWEKANVRWANIDVQLEYTKVGGRNLGTNSLPSKLHINSLAALEFILGKQGYSYILQELLEITRLMVEDLVPWVKTNPAEVIKNQALWRLLLGVVVWVQTKGSASSFVRQIDVPGVDTKFVERHRSILAKLLDASLPPEKVSWEFPPSQFEKRYNLATKPAYVRLRSLDGPLFKDMPYTFSEAYLRLEEARDLTLVQPRRVFIIENEITYLSLPSCSEGIAIFGGGYGVGLLGGLAWLENCPIYYWGDLDTHGFAILNQLRSHFPHVRSFLMDRSTLLDHRDRWGSEVAPKADILEHLTPVEQALYRDLVLDTYVPNLRLEQERISYEVVCDFMRAC